MGIPGFFGFIKKYNNPKNTDSLIKTKIPNKTEIPNKINNDEPPNIRSNHITINNYHFYLDFNGAVYTVNNKYKPKTEESLVIHTISYLDTLVNIYMTDENVHLKTLFIAMDGVPPRSKIEQQRQRRFHSINQKNSQRKINETYGNEEPSSLESSALDTNMITPGTQFMSLLKTKLEVHLNESTLYNTIDTVIFSSSDVPGEGEHKILEHIKNTKHTNTPNNTNNINHTNTIIIYGLDADLIMLSLVSHKDNIYLLREKTEYGSYSFEMGDYKFLYLDINILKLYILNEMLPMIPDISMFINNNDNAHLLIKLINDYVFINFLLGNDFIPKLPWFSISNNFNDTLLQIYCRCYNQHRQFLINYDDNGNMTINSQMFYVLLDAICHIEEDEYKIYYEKRQRRRINMRDVETEKERRERLLKFFPLQHLHIEREINPVQKDWRHNYYKICFNIDYTHNNMDDVCSNYLESILWTFKYYFNGDINWDWSYKYHYGPTAKDILNYLDREITASNMNKSRQNAYYNINKIKFKKSQPVTQQQLLLMVLPTASKKLLPRKYADLIYNNIYIKRYFPTSYRLSIPYHSFYWECKPILPFVDLTVIKRETKNIKMTKPEEQRNKTGTEYKKTNN